MIENFSTTGQDQGNSLFVMLTHLLITRVPETKFSLTPSHLIRAGETLQEFATQPGLSLG